MEMGLVMMDIKAPRGVRDILPDESWKWAYVVRTTAETMADFGCSEVHLPLFEQTELFSRGVGETTDIVEKEMYTFLDRGGRSVTLRPEAGQGSATMRENPSLRGYGRPAPLRSPNR